MLLRSLSVVLLVCLLSACGFRAVYSERPKSVEVQQHLSAVNVSDFGNERYHQVLRNELQRKLNRGAAAPGKFYELNIVLTRGVGALGVQQDKQITRYNLVFNAMATLKNQQNNDILTTVYSKLTGSYDAVSSDFSTYVAEKDVELDIMRDMAQDISGKLSAYFSSRIDK